MPNNNPNTPSSFSQPLNRPRRPALIPYSAFTTLESPRDLSSILPHRHGGTYILPPPPPPPAYAIESYKDTSKSGTDDDMDMDWTDARGKDDENDSIVSKRWSLKDVSVEEDCDVPEEFATKQEFFQVHADKEIVEDDLFLWVNSPHDPEEEAAYIESLPTSPTTVRSMADIESYRDRMIEASRILNELR